MQGVLHRLVELLNQEQQITPSHWDEMALRLPPTQVELSSLVQDMLHQVWEEQGPTKLEQDVCLYR